MSNLRFRLTVVVAAVLLSVWVILPTFLGKDVQARLEAAAARATAPELAAPATPDPWFIAWLPNKVLTRGLDLQGGIDLTLDVDTEEAVRSAIQRDIAPVKASAAREDLKLGEVRRHRTRPALLVSVEGSNVDGVKAFFQTSFKRYRFVTTDTVDGRDWLLFQMKDDEQSAVAKASVDQALETIRNRIDETGTKEPSITRKGERGISVQLPGETDMDEAVAAVGTTAQLEFILVDETFDEDRMLQAIEAARASLEPKDFEDDRRVTEWLQDNGWFRSDQELLWEHDKVDGKSSRARAFVLKGGAILTGDDVNDARSLPNAQNGQYYVSLAFKPQGQRIFAQVTGDNVGKRFAIVLDREIKSAPTIQEKINGDASITMGSSEGLTAQAKEAGNLALVLRTGALPAPVTVGEVRTVGASLGETAVREGVWAAILGSLLVCTVATVYYRLSGFLATLSLAVNGMAVLALLIFIGATLTLPGICGIALTIGMAVDCNVIIYERIREELRAGKGPRAAIETGFDRAFEAVIDSNVANLLAGVVLYSYGTGPLKGFGVTLMLGVFTTLFTGVFVSRTFMDLAFGRNRSATTISI
jgi:preprotein translocase subunit SecD